MLHCVVCGQPITGGGEHYANAWERARRVFPCCSEACGQKFDPDVHWIPGRVPEPATPEDAAKLLSVAEQRLRQGDNAAVIARELLAAGVPVHRIRGLCVQMGSAALEDRKERRELGFLSVFGGLLGLLTGHGKLMVSKAKGNPDSVQLALDDIDVWERRFSEQK